MLWGYIRSFKGNILVSVWRNRIPALLAAPFLLRLSKHHPQHCYVLLSRQPSWRESWDFWLSSISGYLSSIKHIAQVLLTKKAENLILECVSRYVMDEALGNYLSLSVTAQECDGSAMPRTGHWALGIWTLSEVQKTAMESRTKMLDGLDLHVLKKKAVRARQEGAQWYPKGLWVITQGTRSWCVLRDTATAIGLNLGKKGEDILLSGTWRGCGGKLCPWWFLRTA